MATINERLDSFLPSGESIRGFVETTASLLALLLIVIIVTAVILYFYYMNKKFRNKITVFEKISGQPRPTGRYKSAEVKVGDLGTAFYIKKLNKYLPRGEIQMGVRNFWYGIREDGEWINIGLQDLNYKSREAEVFFTHPDMRYAHTQLIRASERKFSKLKWWQQYAPYIGLAIFVLILGFMLWFLLDKIVEISSTASSQVKEAHELQKTVDGRTEVIIDRLMEICEGGKGYVPVET